MTTGPTIGDMVGRTRTVRIDGQELTIRPAKVRDMPMLADWAKEYLWKEAVQELRNLEPVLTPEERSKMIDDIRERQRSLRFEHPDVQRVLDQTDEGALYMLYLAVRSARPAMTWEQFQDTEVGHTIGEVKSIIDAVNGLEGGPGKDDGEPPAGNRAAAETESVKASIGATCSPP